MSLFRIICLICDAQEGTLQRLGPHKLYCCTRCLETFGGRAQIIQQLPLWQMRWNERRANDKQKTKVQEKGWIA